MNVYRLAILEKVVCLIVFIVFAMVTQQTNGDVVIDQTQNRNRGTFGLGSGDVTVVQGVTTGRTGQLVGFEFVGNRIPGAVFLDVFVNVGPPLQNDPNDFEAEVLVRTSDQGSFVFIDTSSAGIFLNSGDQFEIGFTGQGVFDVAIGGPGLGDLYTGGDMFVDGNNVMSDLTFRTYMNVPEPSSFLVLFVSGGLIVRRKR